MHKGPSHSSDLNALRKSHEGSRPKSSLLGKLRDDIAREEEDGRNTKLTEHSKVPRIDLNKLDKEEGQGTFGARDDPNSVHKTVESKEN
jgi:hypothetical protein